MPLYLVRDSAGKGDRLVTAVRPAAALRHVTANRFSVELAEALDIHRCGREGIEIEYAEDAPPLVAEQVTGGSVVADTDSEGVLTNGKIHGDRPSWERTDDVLAADLPSFDEPAPPLPEGWSAKPVVSDGDDDDDRMPM